MIATTQHYNLDKGSLPIFSDEYYEHIFPHGLLHTETSKLFMEFAIT
jgi:hypothetical protein